MFDLTKEIILEGKDLRTYRTLRLILFLFSLFAFLYVAFLILFPAQSFVFSFLNPDASSNTITRPRNSSGEFIRNGKIPSDTNLYFDASLVGNYSKAKINFTLNKKSEQPEFESLQAVRSYQAFLYPEGSPLGFKDGTLLKNNRDYYIVSAGELHKFQSFSVVKALGFPENSFLESDANDLNYNAIGSPILDEKKFPDASLFKIADNFYLLKNGELQKFIGPESFLSQYRPEQALEKNSSFLDTYPLSENFIGFSDGSLISYADSVYVISDGKYFPIDSTITFAAAGYNWNDVIPATGDELSIYKKARLFTLKDAHPNGTVFSTTEDGKFYMINNGEKNPLPTEKIAFSWLRKIPVVVSEAGSIDSISCDRLTKEPLTLRSYSCELELDKLKNLLGKDFEFNSIFKNNVEIDKIDIKFEKTFTLDNLKQTIAELLSRVKNNYVQQ